MMLLTGMVGMVITQDLQCDWVALHFHTPNMTQWHTIFLNLATSKTQQICETSSIFDGECIGKASINGGYNLMFPIEILFKKTIYIYIYLSIYLSVCLSIYLFIYLSIYWVSLRTFPFKIRVVARMTTANMTNICRFSGSKVSQTGPRKQPSNRCLKSADTELTTHSLSAFRGAFRGGEV